MRRTLFAAALTALVVVSATDVLTACGDKFLLVGWGIKNRTYVAAYPSTILVYARPGGAAALADPKFVSTLTRAGHKVSVVQTEQELGATLGTGRFHLTLTDLRSAPSVASQVTTASVKPLTLPVLHKASKAEAEACKQQYTCVKLSDRPDQLLKEIDGVRKAQVKAAQKKAS